MPRSLLALFVLLANTGCSAFLDWNDFTGPALEDAGTSSSHDASNGDGAQASDGDPDAPSVHFVSCGDGLRCASTAPQGWSGPFALLETSAGAAPGTPCGLGYGATPVFDGNDDLNAPAAACGACTCSAPAGVSCTGPVMTFFSDNTCSTSCGSPVIPSVGACTTTPPCQAVTISGALAVGGTCSSSGGAATRPPVTWSRAARACAPATPPAQGTCSADQVCAPLSAAPYSPRLCVMRDGASSSCPAPGYPAGPFVYYAGVDDTRACSACACAGASGGRCSLPSPPLRSYCVGPSGSLSAPSPCSSFAGGTPIMLTGAPKLEDVGSCTPIGGAPIGGATGAHATTFCCEP